MAAWIAAGVVAAIALLAAVGFGFRKKIGARPLPDALKPGERLPSFTAIGEDGRSLSSDELRGAPAVILFVRGNWCPFCERQVADLTRHYQRINELGARLILITPKPLETTRRVAEFFRFDFEFWLDEDLAIGERVGLRLENGVPDDHRGEYGGDTLWPAAVVTDADGVIRYAGISRFVADRPRPERLVRTLETLADGKG